MSPQSAGRSGLSLASNLRDAGRHEYSRPSRPVKTRFLLEMNVFQSVKHCAATLKYSSHSPSFCVSAEHVVHFHWGVVTDLDGLTAGRRR